MMGVDSFWGESKLVAEKKPHKICNIQFLMLFKCCKTYVMYCFDFYFYGYKYFIIIYKINLTHSVRQHSSVFSPQTHQPYDESGNDHSWPHQAVQVRVAEMKSRTNWHRLQNAFVLKTQLISGVVKLAKTIKIKYL